MNRSHNVPTNVCLRAWPTTAASSSVRLLTTLVVIVFVVQMPTIITSSSSSSASKTIKFGNYDPYYDRRVRDVEKRSSASFNRKQLVICRPGAVCGTVQRKLVTFRETNDVFVANYKVKRDDIDGRMEFTFIPLCECLGKRSCPEEWEKDPKLPWLGMTASSTAITHGETQYKFCFDNVPTDKIEPCKTESTTGRQKYVGVPPPRRRRQSQIFYSVYVLYVGEATVMNDHRINCICPATHDLKYMDMKEGDLGDGITALTASYTCSLPECEPEEPCQSMMIKPFYFSHGRCSCPNSKSCPSKITDSSTRFDTEKGYYYLQYCQ
ncbi:Uncharacterised protein g1509 [Pycnogonum litorale]